MRPDANSSRSTSIPWVLLILANTMFGAPACENKRGIDQKYLNNNASGADRDATRTNPDTLLVDSLKRIPAKSAIR